MRILKTVSMMAFLIASLSAAAVAEDVAVLISGGYATTDGLMQDCEYWYDMFDFYATLVEAGYSHESIIVLYGDGEDGLYTVSTGEWRESNYEMYRNPYPIPRIVDHAARKDTIQAVLGSLDLDEDDTLVLWWMGHGTPDNPQSPPPWNDMTIYVEITDGESQDVRDDEFASYVAHLSSTVRVFSFMTCFSGGMLDDLRDSEAVVMTSSDTQHASESIKINAKWHAEYHYFETCALRGQTPEVEFEVIDCDYDDDGIVTFGESFFYAEAGTDQSPPQISDIGDMAGTSHLWGSFLGYVARVVDDDGSGASDGNGDGGIDPGETVELTVTVRNMGGVAMEGATGTLSVVGTDPYITITQSSAPFGDIPAGGEGANAVPFVLEASSGCPDGHAAILLLEVTGASWTGSCMFNCQSGGLAFVGIADPDVFEIKQGDFSEIEQGTYGIGDADGYLGASDRVAVLTTTLIPGIPREYGGQLIEYDPDSWTVVDSFLIGDVGSVFLRYGGLAFDDRNPGSPTFWCARSTQLLHFSHPAPDVLFEATVPEAFSGLAFDADNGHLWGITPTSPARLYEYDVSAGLDLIQGPIEISDGISSCAMGLTYDEELDLLIVTSSADNRILRYMDVDPAGSGGAEPLVWLDSFPLPLAQSARGAAVSRTDRTLYVASNPSKRPRALYCYECPWVFDHVLRGEMPGSATVGGRVCLLGDLVVQPGAELQLAAGTEFLVSPVDRGNLWSDPERCELVVRGGLRVSGTESARVTICADSETNEPDQWAGIRIEPGASCAVIEEADLSNAVTCLRVDGVDVEVDGCSISGCMEGVRIANAGGALHDVVVSGCEGEGFHLSGPSTTASTLLDSCRAVGNATGFCFGAGTDSCRIENGSRSTGNLADGIVCRSAMTIGPQVVVEGNGADGVRIVGAGDGGLLDRVRIVSNVNGAGCRCDSSSSPWITGCYIEGNYDNVVAMRNCLPLLGSDAGQAGDNAILTPLRYHVSNLNKKKTILAQNCYWGPCGYGYLPEISMNGSVLINPWLEEDPTAVMTARFAGRVPVNRLLQNFPNPFNPVTRIRFHVATDGARVLLAIYDVSGRHVRTLVNGATPAGDHTATWDGRNEAGRSVATGVYFYRIGIGGGFSQTRKMVLLR